MGLALALLAASFVPASSWARSSGGYARAGGSMRTPSFGGGGAYRSPSAFGGYSRPAPRARTPYVASSSAGDRVFSESRSASALDAYRQTGARANAAAPTLAPGRPSFQQAGAGSAQANWFGSRGWATPPPAYAGARRQFGVWDGLFLWTLLSNIGRPGSTQFFHDNENDPGYRTWRAEADRLAPNDAALRAKLDELDRQLAMREGQARQPGALPPELPAAIATAAVRTPGVPAASEDTDGVLLVVILGVAGFGVLAWLRTRRQAGASPMTRAPTTPLGAAMAMMQHKLSGTPYVADKFRIGMTLQLDPTPWVLADRAIKLPQPNGTGSGQISVSAIGQAQAGVAQLTRLYLADDRFFVQLHVDAAGDPDECRLFGTIDTVTPADPDEWAVWLEPNEGMIGWPEFQTKDGKLYDRVWAPGGGWVAPRALTETIEALSGTRVVQSQLMLYAAATGLARPAPPAEFILVAAIQDGGRAWIEIRAGIDLNPAILQLA